MMEVEWGGNSEGGKYYSIESFSLGGKCPKEEDNRNVGRKQGTALHTFQSLLLIMTKKKLLFLKEVLQLIAMEFECGRLRGKRRDGCGTSKRIACPMLC